MLRRRLPIIMSLLFFFFLVTFSLAADPTPDPATIARATAEFLAKICSGHGGVNCSIINKDASIVCNDGTIDTSLSTIYAVPQCQKIIEARADAESDFMAESGCFPPSELRCIDENSYRRLYTKLSQNSLADSELGMGELVECREQMKEYDTETSNYKQCLTDNGKPNFEPSGKIILPILKTLFCPLFYGNNSSYDLETNLCLCDTGYFLQNGQCVQADKICKSKYGSRSSAKNGSCIELTPTPTQVLPTPTPSKINFTQPPVVTRVPNLNSNYEPGLSSSPEDRYIELVSPTEEKRTGVIQNIINSIMSRFKKMLNLF